MFVTYCHVFRRKIMVNCCKELENNVSSHLKYDSEWSLVYQATFKFDNYTRKALLNLDFSVKNKLFDIKVF